MLTKEYPLETLKEDILKAAYAECRGNLDHFTKKFAVSGIDSLFNDLGITGVEATTKGHAFLDSDVMEKFYMKYGFGNACTVLSSRNAGSGAQIVIAHPDLEEGGEYGRFHHILSISQPIESRDWQEKAVLKELCKYLSGWTGLGSDNRIKVRLLLTTDSLRNYEQLCKGLRKVSPAYQAFREYQRERDKEISDIAVSLLRKIPYDLFRI